MKTFAVYLLVLAAAIGAFGYWGYFTKEGSAHFDEMAGMIPFFAMVIAGGLVLIACVVGVVVYFKERK